MKTQMFNYGIEQIDKVANSLYKTIIDSKVNIIVFQGEMGAGKTTIVREIIKYFDPNFEVSSPTYSIINTYSNNQITISHVDCCRIQTDEEYDDIGMQDSMNHANWTFIEWGRVHLLTTPYLYIKMTRKKAQNERVISLCLKNV